MYDESKIPSIVSSILNGSMSPDDAIKAMILKERWCSKQELLSTWIQLIKTKKIVSNRAFEIGTMLNHVDVWITLLECRVLSTEKIWEAAVNASKRTCDENKTFTIWKLVSESLALPLLSITEMFELAKNMFSEKMLVLVLKSGRLSPNDVLTTGYISSVVKHNDGTEDFRSYLNHLLSLFESEFWEKEECLLTLRKNPKLGVASLILQKIVLDEDELDEICNMKFLDNPEQWKVARYLILPMIKQESLSYSKALMALDKFPDHLEIRIEILRRFGKTVSDSDFLSIFLGGKRKRHDSFDELYNIAQQQWSARGT